jgi:hypothetical protein
MVIQRTMHIHPTQQICFFQLGTGLSAVVLCVGGSLACQAEALAKDGHLSLVTSFELPNFYLLLLTSLMLNELKP